MNFLFDSSQDSKPKTKKSLNLKIREKLANSFLKDVHLLNVHFGEHSVTLSNLISMDTQAPTALGQIGMDASTGRVRFYMGTGAVDAAHLQELASVANGKGASLIGVEDINEYFTATTVEGVLNELYTAAGTATTLDQAIDAQTTLDVAATITSGKTLKIKLLATPGPTSFAVQKSDDSFLFTVSEVPGGSTAVATGGNSFQANSTVVNLGASTTTEVSFRDTYLDAATFTPTRAVLASAASDWTNFETNFGNGTSIIAAINSSNSPAEEIFDRAADSMVFYDASGSAVKRDLWSDVAALIAGTGLSASSGVLAVNTGSATVTFTGGTWTFPADSLQINSPPDSDFDAANKAYVDSVAAGLDWKESVRLATTSGAGNIPGYVAGTITIPNANTTYFPTPAQPAVIDGVDLVNGNRVLVKNQTDAKQNGIYVVTAAGTGGSVDAVLDRAPDHDGTPTSEVSTGNATFVEAGSDNASSGWTITSLGSLPGNVISLDTDNITWAQFSGSGTYSAGFGLSLTGSTFSVNKATSYTGGNEWTGSHTFGVGGGSPTGNTVTFEQIAGNSGASSDQLRIASGTDVIMMGSDQIVPNTTGQGSIGTSTKKFAEVNAVTITSGDHVFQHPTNGAKYRMTEHPTDGLMVKNENTGKWYRIPMVECDAPEYE